MNRDTVGFPAQQLGFLSSGSLVTKCFFLVFWCFFSKFYTIYAALQSRFPILNLSMLKTHCTSDYSVISVLSACLLHLLPAISYHLPSDFSYK